MEIPAAKVLARVPVDENSVEADGKAYETLVDLAGCDDSRLRNRGTSLDPAAIIVAFMGRATRVPGDRTGSCPTSPGSPRWPDHGYHLQNKANSQSPSHRNTDAATITRSIGVRSSPKVPRTGWLGHGGARGGSDE
jgi:hypothetical protein